MLSHSISLGNNRSELQFIGDLINLCKRHKISCGKPKDLNHLGSDLLSNDDFRADLFSLCTAIGHMAEVEPSPEQLLVLVARAFAGPEFSIRDAAVDIPPDASSAFLDHYQTWSNREPDFDPNPPSNADRASTPESSQPGPTLYYSAASHSGSDETREDLLSTQPATGEPSHPFTSPNTPLENLTLNELRMYLRDIESRVSRIEPKLEQIAPQAYFTPEYFERLEALGAKRAHEAKEAVSTRNPEPILPPEPIAPTRQLRPSPYPQYIAPIVEVEPVLEPVAYAPRIIPYQPTVISDLPSFKEIPYSASETARVHRLRAANAILIAFLIVACCFAAIFAFRYFHPPPTFEDAIHRFPVRFGEPPLDPTPEDAADIAVRPGTGPSPVLSAPTIAPPNSIPHPLPPRQLTTKAGTIKLASHSVGPASHPTRSPAPMNQTYSQIRVTPAYALPDRNDNEVSAPFRSADPPTPVSINHGTLKTNVTVAVPPTMMMTYAISTPKPIYPSFGPIGIDSTVDVEVTISKDGKVINAQALNGTDDVRTAAVQAVQAWRFRPFRIDGNPVEVVTTFRFIFEGQ